MFVFNSTIAVYVFIIQYTKLCVKLNELFLKLVYSFFNKSNNYVTQHNFIVIALHFYQFHVLMMPLTGNGYHTIVGLMHKRALSFDCYNIGPRMLYLDLTSLFHNP